jgi:Uma2 family endonuclease
MKMMSTQVVPFLTIEQYLEIERAAETRSEYLAGGMNARAGASLSHANLVAATAHLLYSQLRGRECSTFATDLRLYIRQHDVVTYPDVIVTCPPFQSLDNRKDTVTDATVIVEVLSLSTKNYDRSERFLFYRTLPSFREYLLLAQDRVHAEHYVRQSDGSWLMRENSSVSDEIDLKAIDCRLRLADVYERVEFEIAS